jgi:bifunctional non-homologous end joining protein LigD
MLSRPGPLPAGAGWSFELKWDGFRALVSTEDDLQVRSRRGWNMTPVLPELRDLPTGLLLDGEVVAWKGSEPYFRLVCRRVLNRDMSVPLTFVIFDLLRRDGVDLTSSPYVERRQKLEGPKLDGRAWTTCETFDDGRALFTAVCELGFEGVVAKNHSSLYRPNDRGWVKIKNPNYWRRDAEHEAMSRNHKRRARTRVERTPGRTARAADGVAPVPRLQSQA